MANPLENMYQLKSSKSKRISSYDRSGGNNDNIPVAPGQTATLAKISGTGVIRHIWVTIACQDKMIRRNAILRMYWDGEDQPSVESPIGDFFGQGFSEEYNFISLPLAAAPMKGRALNCYFPMPFSNGATVTIENQSAEPIRAFYYYIDYEELAEVPANWGRFHAWWHRELTDPAAKGENEWQTLHPFDTNKSTAENYVFLEAEGQGHVAGINYYVDSPGPIWYGEGDDMWQIDGEPWPGSLHGTGTEDFFNSSWCPKEQYMHPYFGYARVNDNFGWLGRTHCYRFFIADPIHFSKSIRGSIEHGHANCLTLDICSVAYWYQTEPHKQFPTLLPVTARQNMPVITARDIHIWRHAWREAMGGGKLWGNEKKE